MDSWNYSAEVRMQEVLTTRTVYVNRNFNRENTKVLVNPYFKHSVHINPNFGANVYVNPSILKSHYQPPIPPPKNTTIQPPIPPLKNTTFQPPIPSHKNSTIQVPLKVSRFSKINKISTQIKPNNQLNNTVKPNSVDTKIGWVPAKTNPIITKPTTINNVISQTSILPVTKQLHSKKIVQEMNENSNSNLKRDFTSRNIKLVKCEVTKSSPRPSNCHVISKYKLLKKVPLSNNIITSKYKLVRMSGENKKRVTSPRKTVKSKFKVDNRSNKIKIKLNVKAYLMNIDPQREIIKKALYRRKMGVKKLPKMVKINGITYRFNAKQDVLHKMSGSTKFDVSKVKKKIVINGITYVRKDSLTYVRKYANNLVKINSKVLKKDNNPCLVFRRTGKCALHTKGKCIKQHNPNQISICIRFLQGACHDKTCLLSHNISSEKMPTCKYFLEGCCRNDDCQYLHVKLSKNAEVCKDFLEGYCLNGVQCMKKHQFLCPAFEKTGSCSKRNCPYPHGEAVRQYTDKILNKIARSTLKLPKKVDGPKDPDNKAEPDPSHRYYKEETAGVKSESNGSESNLDEEETGYVRRPKLGDLPSFIGFDD